MDRDGLFRSWFHRAATLSPMLTGMNKYTINDHSTATSDAVGESDEDSYSDIDYTHHENAARKFHKDYAKWCLLRDDNVRFWDCFGMLRSDPSFPCRSVIYTVSQTPESEYFAFDPRRGGSHYFHDRNQLEIELLRLMVENPRLHAVLWVLADNPNLQVDSVLGAIFRLKEEEFNEKFMFDYQPGCFSGKSPVLSWGSKGSGGQKSSKPDMFLAKRCRSSTPTKTRGSRRYVSNNPGHSPTRRASSMKGQNISGNWKCPKLIQEPPRKHSSRLLMSSFLTGIGHGKPNPRHGKGLASEDDRDDNDDDDYSDEDDDQCNFSCNNNNNILLPTTESQTTPARSSAFPNNLENSKLKPNMSLNSHSSTNYTKASFESTSHETINDFSKGFNNNAVSEQTNNKHGGKQQQTTNHSEVGAKRQHFGARTKMQPPHESFRYSTKDRTPYELKKSKYTPTFHHVISVHELNPAPPKIKPADKKVTYDRAESPTLLPAITTRSNSRIKLSNKPRPSLNPFLPYPHLVHDSQADFINRHASIEKDAGQHKYDLGFRLDDDHRLAKSTATNSAHSKWKSASQRYKRPSIIGEAEADDKKCGSSPDEWSSQETVEVCPKVGRLKGCRVKDPCQQQKKALLKLGWHQYTKPLLTMIERSVFCSKLQATPKRL